MRNCFGNVHTWCQLVSPVIEASKLNKDKSILQLLVFEILLVQLSSHHARKICFISLTKVSESVATVLKFHYRRYPFFRFSDSKKSCFYMECVASINQKNLKIAENTNLIFDFRTPIGIDSKLVEKSSQQLQLH